MPDHPIVIAVPHAGRDYPASLLADAAVPAERLRPLEDRFADRLIEPLVERGMTCVVAERARAWLDLNRDPREIDATMLDGPAATALLVTTRSRSGLGLVPRRLGTTHELWRRKFSHDEIRQRIGQYHRPYHQALTDALAAARARFGIAILLDCHSMPPIHVRHSDRGAAIVIGDRFGRSAAPCFADCLEGVANRFRMTIARNAPYAGGYSLDHHGRPQRDIHALQIEIDRSLYLDSALDQPAPALAKMQRLLKEMVDALSNEAFARPATIAAE